MVKKRRRHTAEFKFRVALEALEGSKTISQLSSEHEIHANMIRAWKRQLLEDGLSVFVAKGKRKQGAREAELYEQIERLKMELGGLKGKVEGSNQ
ncbi:MAG: transposase [Gammaproteobacteria bacterium]|nr:transposase [Gammaproteobacteria bacterium]